MALNALFLLLFCLLASTGKFCKQWWYGAIRFFDGCFWWKTQHALACWHFFCCCQSLQNLSVWSVSLNFALKLILTKPYSAMSKWHNNFMKSDWIEAKFDICHPTEFRVILVWIKSEWLWTRVQFDSSPIALTASDIWQLGTSVASLGFWPWIRIYWYTLLNLPKMA